MSDEQKQKIDELIERMDHMRSEMQELSAQLAITSQQCATLSMSIKGDESIGVQGLLARVKEQERSCSDCRKSVTEKHRAFDRQMLLITIAVIITALASGSNLVKLILAI